MASSPQISHGRAAVAVAPDAVRPAAIAAAAVCPTPVVVAAPVVAAAAVEAAAIGAGLVAPADATAIAAGQRRRGGVWRAAAHTIAVPIAAPEAIAIARKVVWEAGAALLAVVA